MFYRDTMVTIQSPNRVARLRQEFKDVKAMFKFCSADILDRHPNSQIHHIIPLYLGGTNDTENLVFIDRKTHKLIHAIIDDQIRGMNIGRSAIIRLPVMDDKFWSTDNDKPIRPNVFLFQRQTLRAFL